MIALEHFYTENFLFLSNLSYHKFNRVSLYNLCVVQVYSRVDDDGIVHLMTNQGNYLNGNLKTHLELNNKCYVQYYSS